MIEQYVEYLSIGNCEKAIDLCTYNAKEMMISAAEAGCETFEVKIDSIHCEIRDTICRCLSYENKNEIGTFFIPYSLMLVDGQWKIYDMMKDQLTWEMIDNGDDWQMSNF